MSVQDDVVASIDAADAKIDQVIVVIDTHTAALIEIHKELADAIAAQNFVAAAAAAKRLDDRISGLGAAADRMRATDPAPEPQA